MARPLLLPSPCWASSLDLACFQAAPQVWAVGMPGRNPFDAVFGRVFFATLDGRSAPVPQQRHWHCSVGPVKNTCLDRCAPPAAEPAEMVPEVCSASRARTAGRHDRSMPIIGEIPRDDAPPPRPALFWSTPGNAPLARTGSNVASGRFDLGGQPRRVAHRSGCSRPQRRGDGNSFPARGFPVAQLFAVLLHQIGKTQQDAFTVDRGAPGAAIDKSAPGGHHRPVDIRQAQRRQWWQSPARWPRRLTGFALRGAGGAVSTIRKAMLTV